MPVPPRSRRVVNRGSNTRARLRSAMPVPGQEPAALGLGHAGIGQAILRAGLLALKAVRKSDPRPALAVILALLPEDDPLFGPMVACILAAFERVDRPMPIEAIRVAKPGGGEIMVSLAAREWIAEGRAEGLREGRAAVTLRQRSRRFGPVPDAVRGRVEIADPEAPDRVLESPTLAAVFDEVAA